MKIIWADPAIADLKNIRNYIAQDSERYAIIFVDKVITAVEKLLEFPYIGRVVPEINNRFLREIIYQHYRILYRIEKNAIYILTVVHGGRDLSGWINK